MAHSHPESRVRVIVLVLLACFACYQIAKPLLQRGRVYPSDIRNNEIAKLDLAFHRIKPDLDDLESVGYVSNQGVREWYLTQFSLAPRIVFRDSLMDRTVALYKNIDSLALDSLTKQGFERVDTVNAYLLLLRKAP
jgi:hypothetical protein